MAPLLGFWICPVTENPEVRRFFPTYQLAQPCEEGHGRSVSYQGHAEAHRQAEGGVLPSGLQGWQWLGAGSQLGLACVAFHPRSSLARVLRTFLHSHLR